VIPLPEILSWRQIADWPFDAQVEQDLIISIALVKIFGHAELNGKLAFRGGTALNKFVFPKALRYSEDIDLNRLESSNADLLIDALKKSLRDLFPDSKPKLKRTNSSIKLIYSYQAITQETRKLKIEINVRETLPFEELVKVPYEVKTGFFSGKADVLLFNREEMIGTKIRALYQRRKGRDLFDLYELSKLDLDWKKIVGNFQLLQTGATQRNFIENLQEKMALSSFSDDIQPLLPQNYVYKPEEASRWFTSTVIPYLSKD